MTFIRGIRSAVCVHEGLASLCALKHTMTDKEALAFLELYWEKLTSLTTNGVSNMYGSQAGIVGQVYNKLRT
jgi:hypothetical protein